MPLYQDPVCFGSYSREKLLHVEARSRFMVVSVLFNYEFTRCALEVVNLELGMLKANPYRFRVCWVILTLIFT